MDIEVWRVAPGWPNYSVSSHGRIKRMTTPNSGVTGKILSTFLVAGYPSVNLSAPGSRKSIRIHRLVAEAFLERPNGTTEVNHIDGSRDNNLVSNLEWVTPSGNRLHAYRYGKLSATGELNGYSKLTENAVIEIRGEGDEAQLAKRFGVSIPTVRDVRARRTWNHI